MKKLFLAIIITGLFLSYVNLAYADAQPVYSGVEQQLTDYLCTPSGNPANGDLYNCINRLYRFALVIASSIAVLYIVVAGYIYMSAGGNQESVDKAKSIIESSITALVILFAGFVLLKALNPDLVKFQNIQPPSVIGTTPTGGPVGFGMMSEDEARNYLGLNNINVNAQPPQTQLRGIAEKTLNEIVNLHKACNCQITITGGTEPGHSTGEYSHANGYKVDLSLSTDVTKYIENHFKKISTRKDGAEQWQNTSGGAVYAKETTQGSGAHWDVSVK